LLLNIGLVNANWRQNTIKFFNFNRIRFFESYEIIGLSTRPESCRWRPRWIL